MAQVADGLGPAVSVTDLGIANQLEPGRERAFNGVIDEIALYEHALPHERIQAHAAAVAQLGNMLRNLKPTGGPADRGHTYRELLIRAWLLKLRRDSPHS